MENQMIRNNVLFLPRALQAYRSQGNEQIDAAGYGVVGRESCKSLDCSLENSKGEEWVGGINWRGKKGLPHLGMADVGQRGSSARFEDKIDVGWQVILGHLVKPGVIKPTNQGRRPIIHRIESLPLSRMWVKGLREFPELVFLWVKSLVAHADPVATVVTKPHLIA